MAVSGLGVAYATAGFVLLWSGTKNATLKDTLTSFLHGQAPTASPTGPPTIGLADSGSGSGSGATGATGPTGSALSDAAVKYVGHCYSYGGHSGPDGKSCWDCSSFVNWVLGHDLGHAIPGGSWAGVTANGSQHGPNTVSYLAWSGASTVSNKAADAQAGDLLVWQTHMGIALGNGQMISALNESLGTKVTTISGGSPGAEILFVRRLK